MLHLNATLERERDRDVTKCKHFYTVQAHYARKGYDIQVDLHVERFELFKRIKCAI